MELLKPVSGYEGLYWVTIGGVVLNRHGEALSTHDNGRGYRVVHLCDHGKKRHHRVHRLVAQAFIPNPNNYPEVNHLDERKANNRASNLEWCTRVHNNSYGNVNARRSASLKRFFADKTINCAYCNGGFCRKYSTLEADYPCKGDGDCEDYLEVDDE